MLQGWLIGLSFVIGAIVLGYVPAQLLRKRFGPKQPGDTRALSSEVIGRIGVLHGLILALVFANAQGGMQQLRSDINAEASAIDHVYYNARRYGAAPQLQAASVAYIETVIGKDWPSLHAKRELSADGWVAWREVLEAALALQPQTRRERVLAAQIEADIWEIEKLRQARGYEADHAMPREFWLLAIAGLVLISLLLFVHEITPLHQGMMALYSGYTGLALFLIYDLSHPFSGAMQIGPDAFLASLQSIRLGI
jgi:hypothetical protein